MNAPFVVELSPAEKLAALRTYDRFRHWSALEEARCCLQCGHIITGAQVRVVGPAPFQLECPTEGCRSIPMDWVLPQAKTVLERPEPRSEPIHRMGKLRERPSQLTPPSNRLRQIIGALIISHFRQRS
jgi:hypothetical protein